MENNQTQNFWEKMMNSETSWRVEAACRGLSPEPFFLEKHEAKTNMAKLETARKICGGCPVQQECLEYALANNIHHGVWGGLTVVDRRVLKRARRRTA